MSVQMKELFSRNFASYNCLGNDVKTMSRGEAYFVTAGISSLELDSIFTITLIFSPKLSPADVTLKLCDCSGL